jgi:autotransporter-associated beta strand protein
MIFLPVLVGRQWGGDKITFEQCFVAHRLALSEIDCSSSTSPPNMKSKVPTLLYTAMLSVSLFTQMASAQTTYQWNGATNTSWATSTNWNSATVGVTGNTFNARLNVYNGAGQRLIYSATQGTTVYANTAGRGIVISQAGGNSGSIEITGGSFSTLGSSQADVIGNAQTATLTVSGGTFIGAGTAAGGTVIGLNSAAGTSTLNVSGTGQATFTRLQLSGATTIVNLDGGRITANEVVDVDNSGTTGLSNTTFHFNGGILQAGANSLTNFMGGLTNAYVRAGGANIDTNGRNITISQSLLDFTTPSGGGLTKSGAGTLTLSGTNTYTGATNVNGGTLVVNGNISTSNVTVASGATIGGSGTVGALTVQAGGFVNPGNSPGILNTGNYSQAGTLVAEIAGLSAGTQHDQINVTGTVSLSGSLNAQFSAGSYQLNDMIFLILNDSTDAVTGTFNGLAQNGFVTNFGGFDWVISYNADSTTSSFTGGNDVALRAIPETSTTLLGGLGALALLRRRRK